MPLPTIHVLWPFHTIHGGITSGANSADCCAFTSKAKKIAPMMKMLGYKVFDYGNEGSESEGDEFIPMLTREEFDQFYPPLTDKEFPGSNAVIGQKGWPLFNQRLIIALSQRVKPGDIIWHVFGRSHMALATVFPQCHHFEGGVGFPDKPWDAWRCYESETWRAYHYGRDEQDAEVRETKGLNRHYSFVIPNYFKISDWPFPSNPGSDDSILFLSRITPEKGLPFLTEIIRENGKMVLEGKAKRLKFVFAGQGDFNAHVMVPVMRSPGPFDGGLKPNIEYLGPVGGPRRAELMGAARCLILLTAFIEPFGGAAVESMLCGTPIVTSDYGAFVETCVQGVTGYRVKTLGDALAAIDAVKYLDRREIQRIARSKYSLEACAQLYHQAIQQICEINGPAWYSRRSFSIKSPIPEVEIVAESAAQPAVAEPVEPAQTQTPPSVHATD